MHGKICGGEDGFPSWSMLSEEEFCMAPLWELCLGNVLILYFLCWAVKTQGCNVIRQWILSVSDFQEGIG